MRILVMGGTMFNGLALVRELRKHGHDVTTLNRGRTPAQLPRGVSRLFADRTDHAGLTQVLAGREYDCVFDVSAYRLEDVEHMFEIFRGRIGHYVFVSSTVIYAPSQLLPITEDHPLERSPRQNEYGLQKIACEDFLFAQWREHGFPATVVALSMVFGPHNILLDREQRMFARLLQGRPILIPGDGTTIAQVGYVEDQARALRLVMGQPITFGKRYNLTGGDYFSAEGYVDVFAEVVGAPARKLFVPAPLMDDLYAGRVPLLRAAPEARVNIRSTTALGAAAANQFMLSCLVQRIAPHLHPWNRSVVFGIDRLRRDVGWEPEWSFPAAVERTFDWFRREAQAATRSFDFGWEDDLVRRIEAK